MPDITEVRTKILKILERIAPDIDPATVDPLGDLSEEFEIDSMDFLRMVVEIDNLFDIEIPEADYGEINSLDRLVNYLVKKIRIQQSKVY